MERKDPKDMTASELLRWAANGEPDKNGHYNAHSKLLSAIGGKSFADTTTREDSENIRALADKVDAEIAAARCNPLVDLVDSCIEMHGYPSRCEGERFDRWIERCFIQRPLDENDEPVQFGDDNIDWEDTDECQVSGVQWDATAVDASGRFLATAYDKIVAVAKTDDNGRVKRPAPDVLGADGLPVVEGETVWDTESGRELSVCAIANADAGMIQCSDDTGDCEDYDARHLTHTPPDTQERIDEDAVKCSVDYWGCFGMVCEECPAEIDGEKPWRRYKANNCGQAQMLDLLRRQRELDARKGGER